MAVNNVPVILLRILQIHRHFKDLELRWRQIQVENFSKQKIIREKHFKTIFLDNPGMKLLVFVWK